MGKSEDDRDFCEFVDAQERRLLQTAALMCAGDTYRAEDLVQQTLTRLYLRWSRVRRSNDPTAYAFRSLTNAFIDEGRRAHRRREVPVDDIGERETGSSPPASGDHAGPSSTRQVMLAALATLPPRQRAVVVLRHWLDLDVQETAALLQCSEGTVKSQNSRALANLREQVPDLLHTKG